MLFAATSRGLTPYPPLSLLLPLMPTPTYFHHRHLLPPTYSHFLPPLLLVPTYLFPPTCSRLLSPSLLASTIIACLGILLASTYFITYFCLLPPSLPIHVYFHHCHLPVLTFTAYSYLLPPLPSTCFHHRCLFPPTSIIVTSLGTSTASTCFATCLLILVVGMFQL